MARQVQSQQHRRYDGKVCEMLCGFWYSTSAIIISTSADERASQASQWVNPARNEYKDIS
jgi:hypothetical protein